MPMKPTLDSNQSNYIIIKNVLTKDICELIADYANLKAAVKPNKNKNDLLAGTHREYGDPLMETLLAKFTPQIEEATGLELWPTLSFYYTYKQGNQLPRHKDRSSCEIIAGLCIGADNEFKMNHGSWPLMINNNGKPEAIGRRS